MQLTLGLHVVPVATNQGCASSCSHWLWLHLLFTHSASASPASCWLLHDQGSSHRMLAFSLPFRNGKRWEKHRWDLWPGGCSLCSRQLWSALHCWLVPQSLPASRNSSVVLMEAPQHDGKQPGRFLKGFRTHWSQASIPLWDGALFDAGLACCVHQHRCQGLCRSWDVVYQ